MKPPMNDPVILKQPKKVDGQVQKDERGFPEMIEIPVMARVVNESTEVIDEKGQTRQAIMTVILPPSVTPSLGDEIQVGSDTVVILQVTARKSWSGKKTYYWVTNCGT
ncbi:hypothetical protein PK21_gp15 [Geobacillus phage vB_GthS_PK2.1]|mgnify:CR=1 FL=1|nr:hypothetical protein PK21_gp15 [Geobacillus phage vB_GthS_PK2.1]